MNRYCIIMAGGVGTRFWPLSRQNKPKQFLDIMGTGKSFLRHTFERFAPLVPDENFIVVTNRRYKELIRNILPRSAKNRFSASRSAAIPRRPSPTPPTGCGNTIPKRR